MATDWTAVSNAVEVSLRKRGGRAVRSCWAISCSQGFDHWADTYVKVTTNGVGVGRKRGVWKSGSVEVKTWRRDEFIHITTSRSSDGLVYEIEAHHAHNTALNLKVGFTSLSDAETLRTGFEQPYDE